MPIRSPKRSGRPESTRITDSKNSGQELSHRESVSKAMVLFDELDEKSVHGVSGIQDFGHCASISSAPIQAEQHPVDFSQPPSSTIGFQDFKDTSIKQPSSSFSTCSTCSTGTEQLNIHETAHPRVFGKKFTPEVTRSVRSNPVPMHDLIKMNVYLLQKIHDESSINRLPTEAVAYLNSIGERFQKIDFETKVSRIQKVEIPTPLKEISNPHLFTNGTILRAVRNLRDYWKKGEEIGLQEENPNLFSIANLLLETQEPSTILFKRYRDSWDDFKNRVEKIRESYAEAKVYSRYQEFFAAFESDHCSFQAFKSIYTILSDHRTLEMQKFFMEHVKEIYQESPVTQARVARLLHSFQSESKRKRVHKPENGS